LAEHQDGNRYARFSDAHVDTGSFSRAVWTGSLIISDDREMTGWTFVHHEQTPSKHGI
jgi:hypothetical protein